MATAPTKERYTKQNEKIAEELTLNGIRQLGYDTVDEFIKEYSECILLKT